MTMKLLIWVGLALLSGRLWATEIGVYTSEEVPYQYVDGNSGKLAGFGVEVVQLVLKEVGNKAQIQLQPWARIEQYELGKPNNLIFTTFRNQETERNYRWVGPIVPFKINVYRLKSRQDVQASSIRDLGKYKIGVVAKGGRFRYLSKQGLAANLDLANSNESNIRKFFTGRFDLLPEDPTMLSYSTQKFGLDMRQVEMLFELTEMAGNGYLAFTLGTEDALVSQFTRALERVKSGPAYRGLLLKYGL
jgi:polar amino acid transport system substrate-binding protein